MREGFNIPFKSFRKFTLIELIIVVAIIGILISILIPGLAHAREKGMAAVCMSNLRNQGIGATLHESSNEKLPRGGWGPSRWFHDIADSTEGYTDIFKCPSPQAQGI